MWLVTGIMNWISFPNVLGSILRACDNGIVFLLEIDRETIPETDAGSIQSTDKEAVKYEGVGIGICVQSL